MKYTALYFLCFIFFFFGCSQKEITLKNYKNTYIKKDTIAIKEDYEKLLDLFQKNCSIKEAQQLYGDLCHKAKYVADPKKFFEENFESYKIVTKENQDTGLLTGYFEISLQGSVIQHGNYRYAIYAPPKDMYKIALNELYPELKKYRLRGRIEGNKIVPYYKRGEKKDLDADVLCYVTSKIDRFFLEVQGSGRIELDDWSEMYVGYADQNGYPYTSIGRYMIQKGYLKPHNVSMQTIKEFLQKHPEKIDEVLNQNASMVFFQKKDHPASGAAGVVLEPMHSIAIDTTKLPLGGMFYYKTLDDTKLSGVVFAQDTGGAIKGSIRADLFTGFSKEAQKLAGELQSPLKLWILLPKREYNE
jgi:membrane-bound lytic murein transglycosylase A